MDPDDNRSNAAGGRAITPLRPAQDVQKILISAPCEFIDEFEIDTMAILHAWPGLRDKTSFTKMARGLGSREAFVLVFRTDPRHQDGFIIPSYDHIGEIVCALLSVLFGKRFVSHGHLESSGFFNRPDLHNWDAFADPCLPHNSAKPRADLTVALSLSEVRRILPLLLGRSEEHTSELQSQ